mmetsp:Transcript_27172/g.70024  ORF Transcript_27172/g.70024 Transcript_27172/m.70024 type:complete len:220 (+) Transcript_27172:303-962(+)
MFEKFLTSAGSKLGKAISNFLSRPGPFACAAPPLLPLEFMSATASFTVALCGKLHSCSSFEASGNSSLYISDIFFIVVRRRPWFFSSKNTSPSTSNCVLRSSSFISMHRICKTQKEYQTLIGQSEYVRVNFKVRARSAAKQLLAILLADDVQRLIERGCHHSVCVEARKKPAQDWNRAQLLPPLFIPQGSGLDERICFIIVILFFAVSSKSLESLSCCF